MISPTKKVLCTPIYHKPSEMIEAVSRELKLLENCHSIPWISPSTIFLDRSGLFSYETTDEGSIKVRMEERFLSVVNLFSSSGPTSERQRRLHYARRRLLISLIAHIWLWGRPVVLDSKGNPVAPQNRRVLSPEAILKFLRETRSHKEHCPCESIRDFLETVREVPLLEDASKWNVMGVTGCLWWDRLHSSEGDIWCSCRMGRELNSRTTGVIDMAQERPPPPYHEAHLPPYQG